MTPRWSATPLSQLTVGQPEVYVFPDLHSDRVLNARWVRPVDADIRSGVELDRTQFRLVQKILDSLSGCLRFKRRNIFHNNYAQNCPFLPIMEVEKPLKQKTFS